MMIVGQVSSEQEAKEIENITKVFVVRNRTKLLALQSQKRMNKNDKTKKSKGIKK